ncbi:MAG: YihY/virulence factor BrkB family protein [Candidatus Omnitrophica bacterium]|nr:YihY/virulence factor BrkB family protein [Candidatus Omnitrophota bacterium]
MIKKVLNFITTDIWRIQLQKISGAKAILIKQLRMVLVSFKGFNEDECQLKASALTFYSLLSIVPVLAMAFGIAKGFGFAQMLENQLAQGLQGQEEVASQAINFANTMLENTRGGVVAGIGVVVLFWTVIKVLGNIESSFNAIWGVREARSIGRKFSDYLSIMLLCPVMIIAAGSVTVFATTQITMITERIALLGFFRPVIFCSLKLLPYCVLWLLFSFIYIFMPNTKVNLTSGIIGGVVAGTIFQITQGAYIVFQVGVAKYNAIYGSFAALPLFLVWLQLSWLIVLFGAEVSFAHQNVDTYEFEPDCLKASWSFKRLFSLRIVNLLSKNFHDGRKALTDNEIAHTLEGPVRLVRDLLYELVSCGIISETKTMEYKKMAYQPAQDVDKLTIKHVIDALDGKGSDNIPLADTEEMKKLTANLEIFSDTIKKSPANVALVRI